MLINVSPITKIIRKTKSKNAGDITRVFRDNRIGNRTFLSREYQPADVVTRPYWKYNSSHQTRSVSTDLPKAIHLEAIVENKLNTLIHEA